MGFYMLMGNTLGERGWMGLDSDRLTKVVDYEPLVQVVCH